ncbi:MAG: porin family protein [Daejeonella sp.]
MALETTMKKIGLLILATVFFYQANAQVNYLPGAIIKSEGDSIKGFIEYGNWAGNPGKINFKKTLSSAAQSFSPADIQEFSVKDEIYISRIVDVETSPVNTNDLTEDVALHLKKDTAFLQTILKGNKSLYYLKNSAGVENFYIAGDQKLELLVYKKYLVKNNDQLVSTSNKRFLGQLKLYLEDCSAIDDQLKNTSYTKASLEKLFEIYYKCSDTDADFQKKTENTVVHIGIFGGPSFTELSLKSDSQQDFLNADFGHSFSFTAGLFFDYVLPRNLKKWSINNELAFSNYMVKGYTEQYNDANNYSNSTYELGYSYIKMNNMVRFKFPVKTAFVYLNGGISNGYAISEKNYKVVKSTFYSNDKTEEGLAIKDTRKHEQGLVLGIGSDYNKLSFELRYERGNGMSNYTSVNSTTGRYFGLLGYRFK